MEHEKVLAENTIPQSGSTPSALKATTTKLPELVITQFSGKYTDWLRFLGQFKAEIDNSEVSNITKFSYLKELVDP